MNMKNKYFYLQMKRSFKKYPAVLLITIVTVCASALCAYGIISQSVGKEENRKKGYVLSVLGIALMVLTLFFNR